MFRGANQYNGELEFAGAMSNPQIAPLVHAYGCERFVKNSGAWYRYNHVTGELETTALSTSAVVALAHTGRWLQIEANGEGAGDALHFDMPFGNFQSETQAHMLAHFAPTALYQIQVTGLYFDVSTTCDAVNVYY